MKLDMNYLDELSTPEKMKIFVSALSKGTFVTAIVIAAVYKIFYYYPAIKPEVIPYTIAYALIVLAAFSAFIYGFGTRFYNFFDETAMRSIDMLVSIVFSLGVGIAVLVASVRISAIVTSFILWVGWFPIIPVVAITYMLGAYFKDNLVRKCIYGILAGYALGVVLRVLGFACVIVADIVGWEFLIISIVIELIFLSWYLYNDAVTVIEQNKKDKKRLQERETTA